MLYAILPVLAMLSLLDANDTVYTKTFSKSLSFKQNQNINITNNVGNIKISPGADTLLSVSARIKWKGKVGDLDKIKFSVERSPVGASITVDWPHKRNKDYTAVDLSIVLPRETDINIVQRVGEITIDNIEGNLGVALDVGNISLKYPLTREIKNCRLNINVGNINLFLSEDISANLQARCGVGKISSSFSREPRSRAFDTGDKACFIIGTGNNLFDLNTTVGNIVIEKLE